jgi:hypothetical protein
VVVALAITSMWIRSVYVKDVFVPPQWVGLKASLLSLEHSIAYQHFDTAAPTSERLWVSFSIDGSEINAPGHDWQWRSNGFGYISDPGRTCLVIPYWSLAVPITLLSACLILWKPRKKAVI